MENSNKIDWSALGKRGLSALQGASATLSNQVTTAVRTLRSSKGLDGATAAVTLLAGADGDMSSSEVDTALNNLEVLFEGFQRKDIRERIFGHHDKVAKLDLAVGQENLLAIVVANVTDDGAKRVLVQLLIQIAVGDGTLKQSEMAVIRKIIQRFGLTETDFPRLQAAQAPGSNSAAVAKKSAWDFSE